jgi:hypothetical protein
VALIPREARGFVDITAEFLNLSISAEAFGSTDVGFGTNLPRAVVANCGEGHTDPLTGLFVWEAITDRAIGEGLTATSHGIPLKHPLGLSLCNDHRVGDDGPLVG